MHDRCSTRQVYIRINDVRTDGGLHIDHHAQEIGFLLGVDEVQVAFAPKRGRALCPVLVDVVHTLNPRVTVKRDSKTKDD